MITTIVDHIEESRQYRNDEDDNAYKNDNNGRLPPINPNSAIRKIISVVRDQYVNVIACFSIFVSRKYSSLLGHQIINQKHSSFKDEHMVSIKWSANIGAGT